MKKSEFVSSINQLIVNGFKTDKNSLEITNDILNYMDSVNMNPPPYEEWVGSRSNRHLVKVYRWEDETN